MAKKKEVIVEKPNYLELAINFNSDELLAFYLKKIKEEISTNAKNAYDLREKQSARITALEAEKAKLIDLLQKYQDGYYTDGVIGLTAGFDEAVSRVLAEVK